MRDLKREPLILFLVLFCALPFRETLAGWSPFAYLALFVAIVGLAAYVLAHLEERIRVAIPLALFGLWVLAATLYAPVWDRSFELFGTWFSALLVWFVGRELARRDASLGLKLCLSLWVCASLIAAVNLGLRTDPEQLARAIEQLPEDADFKEALLHAATQERFNAPFGNPIHLGLFLTFALLAVPALFEFARIQPRPALVNSALCLTAGIQLYVLWGAKSRTSILALAAGVLGWLVWRAGRSRRVLAGAFGVCAVCVALMVASPTGREMLTRVETVNARLHYWETALRMIRDHPAVGLGVGGYGDYYPQYRGLTTHQTKFAHNVFIEVLTDQGMVGFVLFLFVLLSCWRKFPHLKPHPKADERGIREKERTLEFALVGWRMTAIVAFIVSAQLDFAYNMPYLIGVFAAIVATRSGLNSPPTTGKGGSVRLRSIPALTFLLLLSTPSAMREIGQAQFEQARTAFMEERDFQRAQRKLELSLRVWPPLAEAQHFYASALRDSGQIRNAEERFRKAIAWEPTTAYMRDDLANMLWSLGRREEAMSELEEAIRLHPVKWDYHHRKSLWLQELGDKEGADREKRVAESLQRFEPDYRRARLDQNRSGMER